MCVGFQDAPYTNPCIQDGKEGGGQQREGAARLRYQPVLHPLQPLRTTTQKVGGNVATFASHTALKLTAWWQVDFW